MTTIQASLLVGAMLGAALSSAGCLFGACDEIGCLDGVEIHATIDGAADTSATVRVFNDGAETAVFECAAPGQACTTPSEQGWVDRTSAGEFTLTAVGAGDVIRIEVELDGETYSAELAPDWEESRPNGPGCEPVCKHATAETVTLTME